MTNHAHGSSLLQARSSHLHRHSLAHKKTSGAIAAGSDADADVDAATDVDQHEHHRHRHHHHTHLHGEFHHNRHQHIHNQHQPTGQQQQEQQQQQQQQQESEQELGQEQQEGQQQELRRRQFIEDLIVTHVVQTVSVIQYVDGTGATLDVSTIFSPPTTHLVDQIAGLTVDASDLIDGITHPTLSVPGDDSSSSTGSSPLPLETTPGSTNSLTSAPSISLSSPSGSPAFSGASNSTSFTPKILSNSTLSPSFLNSSTSTTSSSSTSSSSSSSLTSTTFLFSSTDVVATTTILGDAGAGGAGGGAGVGTEPTAAATTSAGSGGSPPQTPTSTVVGSVVGSICGLALIVFAAVFFLKWKKRRGNGVRLTGGDGDGDWGNTRALPAGSSSSPAPGSRRSRGFSQRMSERGLPFAIPATLAALSGTAGGGGSRGGAITEGPGGSGGGGGGGDGSGGSTSGGGGGGGERGFYRVSGRKLPSVLHHGGDGYSVPTPPLQNEQQPHPVFLGHERNDSSLSGASFYRDSQGNFFGGIGSEAGGVVGGGVGGGPGGKQLPTPRLAVGSPMRPDSGVPVMQPGPARTPVTEHINSSPGLTPPPSRDPLGRSHSSQDGSRGSGSRFMEDIR